MTDHGNIYGAVHFFAAAKARGVKPILGCELYICKHEDHRAPGEGDENNHLLVLAQNEEGVQEPDPDHFGGFALWVLSQAAGEQEVFGGTCGGADRLLRVPERELCEELMAGRYEKARSVAAQYEDIFGKGNFFLEIQDQGLADEKRIHEALFRLEKELAIPLVATNDSHYLCGRTRTRTT